MNKIPVELPILSNKDINNSYNVNSFYLLGNIEKLSLANIGKKLFLPVNDVVLLKKYKNVIPEVSLLFFKKNSEEVIKYKNMRILIDNLLEVNDEIIDLIEKLNFSIHLMVNLPQDALAFMKKYGMKNIKYHISLKNFGEDIDKKLIISSFICGTLFYEYEVETIMLSGRNVTEVYMNSLELLRSLNIDVPGPRIISCPTCSRAEIDLISLAESITFRTSNLNSKITIAVMGCIVNGPGEARESDVGIAGGKDRGLLFKNGKKLYTVKSEEMEEALISLIEEFTGEKCISRERNE